MSKGFSINDILGSQSAPAAPAGLKMQIVMLPAVDIEPNPENSIYEIGDVSTAGSISRSTTSTLQLMAASSAARLQAVTLFPTPPLRFIIAILIIIRYSLAFLGCYQKLA